MAITNQQGTARKPKTQAQKAEVKRMTDANTAEVQRSVDAWRAMQGLPPLEDSKNG